LGLGDDGDCIEDDFDRWQDLLLGALFSPEAAQPPTADTDTAASPKNQGEEPIESAPAPFRALNKTTALREVRVVECPGSVSGTRRVSAKYPMLHLEPSDSSMVRTHLFDESGAASGLYPSDAKLWSIAENRNLNPDPVANGLHELVLAVRNDDEAPTESDAPLYEAGDHLVVYPRNPDCVVEAYLQLLDDVSPHSIIRGTRFDVAPPSSGASPAYPYPFGLTVYETLSHCVDLSAVPSPSLARFILNRKDIDYKNDISKPRRTVLTLLKEQNDDASEAGISLEDLMFALAPIQGRYYSISSSSMKHPRHVRLLYRPVRYVSGRGYLREGLCSTYMSHLNERSAVVARVNSNPSFRLPADPTTPVVILAGGCGVAPFRAFLEQRQALQEAGQTLGDCYLFVGFRNPADAVWNDLMTEGLRSGTLTHSHVAYATGVPNASPLLTAVFRESAKDVWDAIQQGDGHLYICGGAQSFGAAVKRELIDMAIAHGGHDAGTATAYLQELAQSGRLCEDLAD
jgi:NADPH-ferrihemoprotein reductase